VTEVKRLKRLFVSAVGGSWGAEPGAANVDALCIRGTDFDTARLRVEVSRAPTRGFTNADIRSRGVTNGDLIIEKSGGGEQQPVGRAVLWDGDDLVMPTNFAARLRVNTQTDARFATYLLASMWSDGRTRAAIKQTTGIQNLDLAALLDQRISCPQPSAQRAIADYLDRETVRIDALIAAKQRMVELLDERRTALRDNSFASKPGWRLKRLLAGSMAYGVLVPEFVEAGTGTPMLRTYNLTADGRVGHEDIAEIAGSLAQEYRRTSLRGGDVILSVVGSMGRSAVVSASEHGFNLNRPLARLQLRPEIPPRLIWHWTQTTRFMDMARLATGGSTAQPTLNLGDLANFPVGLPQATDLWSGLLRELEDGCGRLDETQHVVSRQLALLQEYRQALITAAVTGQLDIREAA
jgi:type I restriction enzyme, S subunit